MQLSTDSKTILRVSKDDITSDGIFHLPAGVTFIDDSAFENCIDLRKLVISNGVISIGHWAFYGCNKLQTLEIPISIASIGKDVFAGCMDLAYIIIASNNSAEVDRITALLPEWFKKKVITQELFNKFICFRDKQLARLT
ncbi:leucine-rich repeat domain-containing protein [Legionella gresilensis]|uniref:leucine-rich repeat domain-containing protein n=1 Tax=Legionella gresilensis TaxID=91823 RepID=UPI00104156DD|nr:leucine-rich repeat domain-containing protein [Legionella gresilensis]